MRDFQKHSSELFENHLSIYIWRGYRIVFPHQVVVASFVAWVPFFRLFKAPLIGCAKTESKHFFKSFWWVGISNPVSNKINGIITSNQAFVSTFSVLVSLPLASAPSRRLFWWLRLSHIHTFLPFFPWRQPMLLTSCQCLSPCFPGVQTRVQMFGRGAQAPGIRPVTAWLPSSLNFVTGTFSGH